MLFVFLHGQGGLMIRGPYIVTVDYSQLMRKDTHHHKTKFGQLPASTPQDHSLGQGKYVPLARAKTLQ